MVILEAKIFKEQGGTQNVDEQSQPRGEVELCGGVRFLS